mgnify:CR=1 FL=1
MKLVKRRDGYWIEGVPPYELDGETLTANGPYQVRADAESDMRGIARTLEFMDREVQRATKRKKVGN